MGKPSKAALSKRRYRAKKRVEERLKSRKKRFKPARQCLLLPPVINASLVVPDIVIPEDSLVPDNMISEDSSVPDVVIPEDSLDDLAVELAPVPVENSTSPCPPAELVQVQSTLEDALLPEEPLSERDDSMSDEDQPEILHTYEEQFWDTGHLPEMPYLEATGFTDWDNDLVQKKLRDLLAVKWVNARAESMCEHVAAERFLGVVVDNLDLFKKINRIQSYKTMRRQVQRELPKAKCWHTFFDTENNVEVHHEGDNLPTAKFPVDRYQLLNTWTRHTLHDGLTLMDKWHNRLPEKKQWGPESSGKIQIDLSWDGVPLDNKGTEVLEVLSFRRTDCNLVFPLAIWIGKEACKEPENVMRIFLDEIRYLKIKVRYFLADSKARCVLMKMTSINGYYSCQFCLAPGVKNKAPRDEQRRGGAVLWTSATMNQPKRTSASYVKDGLKALRTGKPSHGVKGVSCLTELFEDIIYSVPIDTFHAVYLGMVKKLWKEIWQMSATGRIPSHLEQAKIEFDSQYRTIEVPFEMQRRPREVDLASFKCSEWKSLALFGFPILVPILDRYGLRCEAKVLIQFVYLVRALLSSNEVFQTVEVAVDLDDLMAKFYRNYEHTFGVRACIPSVHLFYHLLEQRRRDSITTTSTELFETFYGVIRSAYHPGTVSMGKQMTENVIIHYEAKSHNCYRTFRVRPKEKDIHNDSLLWTTKGFVRVVKNLTEGRYSCRVFQYSRYTTEIVKKLCFASFGVVKIRRETSETVEIAKSQILAKCVQAANVLVAIPFETLYG